MSDEHVRHKGMSAALLPEKRLFFIPGHDVVITFQVASPESRCLLSYQLVPINTLVKRHDSEPLANIRSGSRRPSFRSRVSRNPSELTLGAPRTGCRLI